jgi:hypothetical protein
MIEASGVHQFHRIDDAGGHYGKCQTMKPPPPYKQRPARDIVKLTATVDASTTGLRAGPRLALAGRSDGSGEVGENCLAIWTKLSESSPRHASKTTRGTGTAEDANGNTLSPGLDRSRD